MFSFPERSFLCLYPNRYVFPGAEVYSDEDDESDNESIHRSPPANGMSPRHRQENTEDCSGDASYKEKLNKLDGVGCLNCLIEHEGTGDAN
jgi:hypothetical protein